MSALRSRLIVFMLAPSIVAAGVAHAAGRVPYKDPDAVGFIGFCDPDGHSMDHGSVLDKPFVWRAIASSPASAPYDGPGRTATLFAYQPRPGVDPGGWSSQQLTGSAQYSNPAHPTVAATARDISLADLIAAYPPLVDGLYQLRMLLGGPNLSTARQPYAATSIRISGDTWQVAEGGTVPCDSGTAVSNETVLHLPGAEASPQVHPVDTSKLSSGSGITRGNGARVVLVVGVGSGIVLLAGTAGAARRRRRKTLSQRA